MNHSSEGEGSNRSMMQQYILKIKERSLKTIEKVKKKQVKIENKILFFYIYNKPTRLSI